MIDAKAITESGLLSQATIRATLEKGLAHKFVGGKILILIPDHTRSLPLPFLFRLIFDQTPLKAENPPSIGITAPVTKDERGEINHSVAPRRSLGIPKRFIGV